MKGESKLLSPEKMKALRQKRGKAAAHRGRAREWDVRDVFRAAGYCVARARASKGEADLIAWRPRAFPVEGLWISVKKTSWPSDAECARMAEAVPEGLGLIVLWPNAQEPLCARLPANGIIDPASDRTDWFRGLVKASREQKNAEKRAHP